MEPSTTGAGRQRADGRYDEVTYNSGMVRRFPIVGETYWAFIDESATREYATVTGSHWGLLVDEPAARTGGHAFSSREAAERHQAALPPNAAGRALAPGRVTWLGGSTFLNTSRFVDAAEADAALAIGRGDPQALDHYFDHDRIHVGDRDAMKSAVLDAWHDDHTNGMDALILGSGGTCRGAMNRSSDLVDELNQRAQQARWDAADQADRQTCQLGDGNTAAAGDIVIASWSGSRLVVDDIEVDGGGRMQLRGRAVGAGEATCVGASGAELGYASPAGQSGTRPRIGPCRTTHSLVTGQETRQELYAMLSRGSARNHLYLALPDASAGRPSAEAAARRILTGIVSGTRQAPAATTGEPPAASPGARAERREPGHPAAAAPARAR